MSETITAVPGVRVGHWTDSNALTGCTVVVLPEPNVAAGEIRGGAPGSRETALLQPGMSVQQAQAFLLTGGSAFGLAAADGVVRGLVEDDRGHDTGVGVKVPIVPAAVIFDLMHGDPSVRPGPDEGYAAYRSASEAPVESGLIGAGTGATAAKWRGLENMIPGGLGSASELAGDAIVGVLAVLNPVGDVFTLEGESLTGGDHVPGPPQLAPSDLTNTTLVVVATDADLPRVGLNRLIVRSHDAIAACVRPSHTRYDGDAVFAASVGGVTADHDVLGEAVFVATARAIENAVRAANG
ncbi:MAG TPA: P1 family peptidase [Acidimicrobiia bacterium]